MLQTGLWENKYRQKVLDGQTLNYFSGLRSWPSPNAATGKAGLSPGSLSCTPRNTKYTKPESEVYAKVSS